MRSDIAHLSSPLRVSVSPWFIVPSSRLRKGFTLTELMVAIVIVVLVAFVGVPLVLALISDLQGKGVTGGSRLVMSAFSMARDKALRDKQPYGVRLVRDEANPWVVDRVRFLQAPANLSSTGSISVQPLPADFVDNDGDFLVDEAVPEVWVASGINMQWFGLIRVGDHLRINSVGPLYEMLGPDIMPPDGYIDAPGGLWNIWVAAEPFPNRDGIGGSIQCSGAAITTPPGTPYQIYRQPVPAEDQEELPLPRGVVIDVLRSRYLPYQFPPNVAVLVGSDNQPGFAGRDDDGNGVTDDITELGAAGSDDAPVSAWPPMDVLFSPTGQVTGQAAQGAVLHLWVGQRGLNIYSANPNPDDLAKCRLLSLYTRTGYAQGNEVGPPGNLYVYAEQALGTRPE